MGAERGDSEKKPTVEEQYLYWILQGRVAMAHHWHEQTQAACRAAERTAREVGSEEVVAHLYALREEARDLHETAKRALDQFTAAHADVSFEVFHPRDIRRAISPDVEPIFESSKDFEPWVREDDEEEGECQR